MTVLFLARDAMLLAVHILLSARHVMLVARDVNPLVPNSWGSLCSNLDSNQ
jgi:hypothetical protein